MCNCRDLKAEVDSPEVDPLQIARRITSKPRRGVHSVMQLLEVGRKHNLLRGSPLVVAAAKSPIV
jgi:hypothetical protein